MKIALKKRGLSASALLITVVVTGILTMAMASYLAMVSSQYRSTMRSQEWNGAIPVTEAGVEEAMAHLNKNCMTNGINVNDYDPGYDGWTNTVDAKYSKTTTLPDGSYYIATVDLAEGDKPIVYSQGFTAAPLAQSASPVFFATIGNDSQISTANTLKRRVRVTTRILPVFNHALAADDSIQMSGNNVATDSFNSTNGPYVASQRNDNGDVATNSDVEDDLDLGNANIRGRISTGPDSDQPEIGPNGVVGSNEYIDGGGDGIQTGYWDDDMNVEFADVEAPFGSGNPPSSPFVATVISNVVTTNVLASCSCTGGNNCCIPGSDADGGIVYPLTGQQTSTSYPSSGSYVGSISTNWTTETSTSYPSGTFRNLQTNSVAVTSDPYDEPEPGTYVGTVSASIQPVPKTKTRPNEGEYEPGSLSQQGPWYTYDVKVYNYQQLTGYTYERISSYTYAAITGYQRAILTTTSTTNTVTFDHGFNGSGDYMASSLSGSIYIAGNVVLYCTGPFSSTFLYIAPNSSLKLYVAGDVSFSGDDKVNSGGYAKNLSLYGLPTCTSVTLHGNAEFTGTIYAPQAEFIVGGGGNDRKDFFGAVIAGSAKLNGHVNFHYDEDLRNSGPSRGYIANSWREEAAE